MTWDEYFIRQAMLVAEKSKDPSTKVGCVLVGEDNEILSTGFNGFPRGVEEGKFVKLYTPISQRWERPEKYKWVEHAERNAIYNAARNGIRLKNARAYLNWEPIPCSDCARAFIQAGIKEIVGPNIPFGGVGAGVHYHIGQSTEMMLESGMKIRRVIWNKNAKTT
jgi:dCMP deaminase